MYPSDEEKQWLQNREEFMRRHIPIKDIAAALREPANMPAKYSLDRIEGLQAAARQAE